MATSNTTDGAGVGNVVPERQSPLEHAEAFLSQSGADLHPALNRQHATTSTPVTADAPPAFRPVPAILGC